MDRSVRLVGSGGGQNSRDEGHITLPGGPRVPAPLGARAKCGSIAGLHRSFRGHPSQNPEPRRPSEVNGTIRGDPDVVRKALEMGASPNTTAGLTLKMGEPSKAMAHCLAFIEGRAHFERDLAFFIFPFGPKRLVCGLLASQASGGKASCHCMGQSRSGTRATQIHRTQAELCPHWAEAGRARQNSAEYRLTLARSRAMPVEGVVAGSPSWVIGFLFVRRVRADTRAEAFRSTPRISFCPRVCIICPMTDDSEVARGLGFALSSPGATPAQQIQWSQETYFARRNSYSVCQSFLRTLVDSWMSFNFG